jgi:nucleoside-specific outer membrane channel protein Tsx
MKKLMRIGMYAVVVLLAGSQMPAMAQSTTMTAQEKANLQLVTDWWREVIQAGHVELAPKYMAEDYIQHNPNISTGRAAFVEIFGRRPARPIAATLTPASHPVREGRLRGADLGA